MAALNKLHVMTHYTFALFTMDKAPSLAFSATRDNGSVSDQPFQFKLPSFSINTSGVVKLVPFCVVFVLVGFKTQYPSHASQYHLHKIIDIHV